MRILKRDNGQTMAEYALAAALVAIVGFGALMMIGSVLSEGLPGLLDRIFGDGQAVASVPGSGGGSAGATTAGGGGNAGATAQDDGTIDSGLAGAWENNQTVCMETMCVDVPVISKADLETAGSLGSDLTDAYAHVLEQIAREMEKNPDVDPAMLKQIRELANYGHEIAGEQRTFANKLDAFCTPGAGRCDITSLDYSSVLPARDSNQDGRPDSVDDFKSLYNSVLRYMDDNPGIVPPGVADIVALEGGQIIQLSDGTTWVCDTGALYMYSGGTAGDNYFSTDFQNRAEIIDQDANVICASGKGGGNCTVSAGNSSSSQVNTQVNTQTNSNSGG